MDNKKQIYPVPEGLSQKAETLWNSVAGRRASSPERLALLETALRSLDRADESSKLISEKGLLCITPRSGVSHLNPLIRIEMQSRSLFIKIWHELGLRFDPPKPTKFEDYKFE